LEKKILQSLKIGKYCIGATSDVKASARADVVLKQALVARFSIFILKLSQIILRFDESVGAKKCKLPDILFLDLP
jgi:hypothetical protein